MTPEAEDFHLLARSDDTLLDLAGRHRSPDFDGVNSLDRHEERLVDGTLRLGDVRIQCVQQLADAAAVHRVGRMIQRPLGIATDERRLPPSKPYFVKSSKPGERVASEATILPPSRGLQEKNESPAGDGIW
jgi:hypothetical protein